MPVDWGVRGDSALKAAQVIGQQNLQARQIRQAERQAAVEAQIARDRMQQQAMLAQQEMIQRQMMQAQALEAQRQHLYDQAGLQAERDAQIDGYAKNRIQTARDWDLYDKGIKETGQAIGDIKIEAEKAGIPYEQLYDQKRQAFQQAEEDRLAKQKVKYLLDAKRGVLDFDQSQARDTVAKREKWFTEWSSKPENAPMIEEMRKRLDQANVKDTLKVEVPTEANPADEWVEKLDSNGVLHGFVSRSSGEFRPAGRDAQKAYDPFGPEALEAEVNYLLEEYRQGGDPGGYVADPKNPKSEVPLFDSKGNAKLDPSGFQQRLIGVRPKRAEDATKDIVEVARRRMYDRAINDALEKRRNQLIVKKINEGATIREIAEAAADKELAHQGASWQDQDAQANAEKTRRSIDVSLVTGQPMPGPQFAPPPMPSPSTMPTSQPTSAPAP